MQVVYVRKDGNDATGDGSAVYPYLTILKAMQSITDNTATKRYRIDVGPGSYVESSLPLKPYVWVEGNGSPIAGPTRVGVDVTADSTFNLTGGARGGFSNIYINGALNFDLTATGHSGATVLEAFNVAFVNGVTYKANNNGDGFDWRGMGSVTFGDVDLYGGGSNFFVGVLCFGNVNIRSGPSGVVQGFNLLNGVCAGNMLALASNGQTTTLGLANTNLSGSLTLTQTSGALNVGIDAPSYPPGGLVRTGTVSFANQTDGLAISFTPTTAGDWTSSPTTVQAGLNEAVVSTKTGILSSLKYKNNPQTGTYTILASDTSVMYTGTGGHTITMLDAATNQSKVVIVTNDGSGAFTLSGVFFINGTQQTTVTVNVGDAYTFVSAYPSGSPRWRII